MIIKCPRCKGKGEVRDSVVTNPLFVVCTLGMSLAMTDKCPTCRGTGFVRE